MSVLSSLLVTCGVLIITRKLKYHTRLPACHLINLNVSSDFEKLSSGGGGGGGGTLLFSSYIGSGPASTVHPPENQKFQAPKKYLK